MNKGVVLFAHNNRKIDYALMSVISGGFAKKHLKVPVSLITDSSTLDWMKKSKIYSKAKSVFDKIILTDRPETNNNRILYDGLEKDVVPFNNSNRSSVWELTPYDRTLLIDSDYLIMSQDLSKYWSVDSDLLISSAINDPIGDKRTGYLDKHVSATGVKLFWATTVMFTKNEKTKKFFETVDLIKEKYNMFSDIYRFSNTQYRNDISFSIAKHIFDGFQELYSYDLPEVLTFTDKDILQEVTKTGDLIFLVSETFNDNYFPILIKDRDVHIINKQSITRHSKKLLDLI